MTGFRIAICLNCNHENEYNKWYPIEKCENCGSKNIEDKRI